MSNDTKDAKGKPSEKETVGETDDTVEDKAGENENSENENSEPNSEGEDTKTEAPKGLKAKLLKNKILFISIIALIIIGGGGVGLYFMGVFTAKTTHEITLELPPPPVFQDIPKITVDLKPSPRNRRPFIRLTMQAELQGETARAAFIAREAKILDALHTHLRTLTVEDLAGSQGTIRLRADVLRVINNIIKPEIAISVLYKEILIR